MGDAIPLSQMAVPEADTLLDTAQKAAGDTPPKWKDGVGVGGGWTCEADSDCSFLQGGPERGW